MVDYDPKVNIRLYPMPNMARFGTNPFGDPLYRIVFAPSRMNLAVDCDRQAHWVPSYRKLGDIWVLERWHSAWDFCRMTEEQWNESDLAVLGTYPSRGEYSHVHSFLVSVEDTNLDKLVMWIEEGRNRSNQDNLDAVKADVEAEKKASRDLIDDVVHDKWSAFGSRDFSSALVSRRGKTKGFRYGAEDLGLPTKPGQFVVANPKTLVKG